MKDWTLFSGNLVAPDSPNDFQENMHLIIFYF